MIITVIRGLPGSGKSSYAHELAKQTGAIIIEPDAFVTVDGEYLYDTARWGKARYLARQIMRLIATTQESDIIYADVLPTRQEVADMLKDIGRYAVGVRFRVLDMVPIDLEWSMRLNRHNVRKEDIRKMIDLWEPWAGAGTCTGQSLDLGSAGLRSCTDKDEATRQCLDLGSPHATPQDGESEEEE